MHLASDMGMAGTGNQQEFLRGGGSLVGQTVDWLLGGGLPVSTIQGRNDKEGASRRRKQIPRRQSYCCSFKSSNSYTLLSSVVAVAVVLSLST